MTAVWIFALLAFVPFALTVFNCVTWRRPQPFATEGNAEETFGQGKASPVARVSVLIPARNEGPRIERALNQVGCGNDVLEIVVYDDQSSDDTAATVERIARSDPRVRLVRGGSLPDGWVGKPHACHQLARAARGDVFLFLDADVALAAGAVDALLALVRGPVAARIVTAVPRQITGTFFERLILPLLVLTYTSWLPLFLVERGRNTSTVAANGQILLLQRPDYEALGGFGSVRREIVDDVAFCRRAKAAGLKVVFVDGTCIASCRMYRSAAEVWKGFSKNIFEGLGGDKVALVVAVSLHACCWLAPYVVLIVGLLSQPAWIAPGAWGVFFCLALRMVAVVRYRQPAEGIALHPFAVIALCAIAINSFLWHLRGRIGWAGRTYGRREQRETVAPALLEDAPLVESQR